MIRLMIRNAKTRIYSLSSGPLMTGFSAVAAKAERACR